MDATMGRALLAVATRTSPAPARSAARPTRRPLPVIPMLPAITRTRPNVPLCPSTGLGGSFGTSRTISISHSIPSIFLLIIVAVTAAEKPLSMLTTVTPEAQLLSMVSRADKPWKLVP